jgi:hypothetical protein
VRARPGLRRRGGAVELGASPTWGRRSGGDDRRAPPISCSSAGERRSGLAWFAGLAGWAGGDALPRGLERARQPAAAGLSGPAKLRGLGRGGLLGWMEG